MRSPEHTGVAEKYIRALLRGNIGKCDRQGPLFFLKKLIHMLDKYAPGEVISIISSPVHDDRHMTHHPGRWYVTGSGIIRGLFNDHGPAGPEAGHSCTGQQDG